MEILNIGTVVCNNYILKSPKGLVVVDTGYPGGFARFRKAFAAKGFKPTDIRFILLTHAHDDHAGFLNELMDDTKAPVILHEAAVDRLALGHNSFSGGCSTKSALRFCKLMALAGKGNHKFPPVCRPDRYLIFKSDEQYLTEAGIDAAIIPLPGHTADSIGLVLPGGVVLCGDAAMNGIPSTANHTIWIENAPDYQSSWDRMLTLDAKTIYPGHGKRFDALMLKRNRHFMDGKCLLQLPIQSNTMSSQNN